MDSPGGVVGGENGELGVSRTRLPSNAVAAIPRGLPQPHLLLLVYRLPFLHESANSVTASTEVSLANWGLIIVNTGRTPFSVCL